MMERGVVYLRGKGWDDFRAYLYSVRISAARMGDRAVASVAAEGRKRGTGIEERLFNLGGQSIKWHKGGWQEGGTRYDPSLGGYRAERNERIRMLHFGWESSAVRAKRLLKSNPQSRVYLSSRLANLFEGPASYSRPSPPFSSSGRWGRWNAGETRPGRSYFLTRVSAAVEAGVPTALQEAKERFRKEISGNG